MQAQPWRAALHTPTAGPLLPPQPPQRRTVSVRRRGIVRCSTQHGPYQLTASSPQQEQRQQDSVVLLGLKAVLMVTAATAAAACMPAGAQASGWTPRRHLQERLRSKFVTEEPAAAFAARKAAQRQQAAAAHKAQQAAATTDFQRVLQSAQRKMKQIWRGEPSYSVGISERQQAYSSSGVPTASPFGWVPLAIAAGIAFILLLGKRLRWPWGGGRRVEGGRWVRDRSLGGKMIFIPDEFPEAAGASKQPRPLYEDDGSDDDVLTAAAAAAAAAAPWATATSSTAGGAAASSAAAALEPEWWHEPNFLVYTSAARKDELQRQARLVLRQLEDGKLLQGLDYSVSDLVGLRTLCQEAGGYQVKPRTESGRDAMLRAGVQAAIAAAQEGTTSLLGGNEPARFVCGLAHDLGVPEKRAITIVHAEVAAVCRSALIDAEAAFRSKNQTDILMALLRVAGALQAFPLPPGSAEAELVAAGVVKQTSMEFRKAVFFEFGGVSPALAALVAEMLGFNPELVMPQLMLQLRAVQAAATMEQQQEQQQRAAQQQRQALEGQ